MGPDSLMVVYVDPPGYSLRKGTIAGTSAWNISGRLPQIQSTHQGTHKTIGAQRLCLEQPSTFPALTVYSLSSQLPTQHPSHTTKPKALNVNP